MADEGEAPAPGAGAQQTTAETPQLSIAAQYVKDFSFENPGAPQSLTPPKERPQIQVNVDVSARQVAEQNYEVELKINVDAKSTERSLFVIELVYAGLFVMQNIPQENLQAVCLVECPRLIFPFARRVIADATRDGGFPPMLIDPIDFFALFRQRMQQQEEPAAPAPESPSPNA